MTQTVRVTELMHHGICKVELQRESACGGNCSSCHGCTAADETIIALAVNTAGASAGDTVVVESRGQDIFRIAALVYLLPVFLLLAGYIAAEALFAFPYAAGIGSAVAFGVGVLIAVLYGKRKKNKVYLNVTHIVAHGSRT